MFFYASKDNLKTIPPDLANGTLLSRRKTGTPAGCVNAPGRHVKKKSKRYLGFPTKLIITPEGYIHEIFVGEDLAFYDALDQLFK